MDADLCEEEVFMSFAHMKRKYNLKGNIFVNTHRPRTVSWTVSCHQAFIFYRPTNQLVSDHCRSLKTIWETDLGCLMDEENHI